MGDPVRLRMNDVVEQARPAPFEPRRLFPRQRSKGPIWRLSWPGFHRSLHTCAFQRVAGCRD